MHGDGTSLDTTKNSAPPARLFDVTRLASRPGRQPTGIDRVELAYLRELLDRDDPVYGLARVAFGYVLLDRDGLTSFYHRLRGRTPWGEASLFFRLFARATPGQKQVQSDLWRLALAHRYGNKLDPLLDLLPEGFVYLNVGHSNLTERTIAPIAARPRSRITVMIHDTIPLDEPETQRADSVERFRTMFELVATRADLILCNSQKTADDVQRHIDRLIEDMTPAPRLPNIQVAWLGVETAMPDPASLPVELPKDRPLFLMVGTIEPRKNHKLILDIWEEWDEEEDGPRPVLGIAGARGWLNESVFRRLDSSVLVGRDIFEWPDLNDRTIATLMTRSQALLFPSKAEGFGLPAVEAAALQTPVLSADLPAIREVLKDYPVYVTEDESYSWKKAIKSLKEDRQAGYTGQAVFTPPDWDTHFKVVLKTT
ncbi:glycosyltransferase family 4 protein [Pseudooceanicola sp. C21-150M6]|uniref:glycosyltransferase family 4 protein n=1 Tax=Pseudooceanicola sp. C21-150M6 TaxID=3434355 RepID=UPI003D7F9D25